MVAGIATLLTACSGNQSSTEESKSTEPVVKAYVLDTAASTLAWTGHKIGKETEDHFGKLKFNSGQVELTDGTISSGQFEINMSSVTVEDMNPEYNGKLAQHLLAPDFFDVAKFPVVTVNVAAIKDGKLPTTVTLLGEDYTQDVPVTTSEKEGKLHIHGEFAFDFEGIASPAFIEENGVRISPKFDYKLHLELTAN